VATNFEIQFDEEVEIKEPKKYKVYLLNDDYSTMDFVIEVLTTIFRKTQEEATKIMMNVHHNGKEVCGVYTYEIASTKVVQVKNAAKQKGFPLKAVMEEE
jgi:ATP-dependent Clp protease adaptor protein ClpS